ncbi:MAG: hypothetical protein ABFS23_04820 [Pseudomonadota bacterium]
MQFNIADAAIKREPRCSDRAVLGLLLGLLLIQAGGAQAGLWDGFSSYFSADRVQDEYAAVILAETDAYLLNKEDVYQPLAQLSDLVLFDEPRLEPPGDSGATLLELRTRYDMRVTAQVAYQRDPDYSYDVGDKLELRLYAATLFLLDANKTILRHHHKVLAARNMSNPENIANEYALVRRLQAQTHFSDAEKKALREASGAP